MGKGGLEGCWGRVPGGLQTTTLPGHENVCSKPSGPLNAPVLAQGRVHRRAKAQFVEIPHLRNDSTAGPNVWVLIGLLKYASKPSRINLSSCSLPASAVTASTRTRPDSSPLRMRSSRI